MSMSILDTRYSILDTRYSILDTRDVDHNSVRHYLIDSSVCNEHDRAECLQVLMNYGLDVEQRLQNSELTRNGTALQIAASLGQKSLVEALLQIGADVSSTDGNGNSASFSVAQLQFAGRHPPYRTS